MLFANQAAAQLGALSRGELAVDRLRLLARRAALGSAALDEQLVLPLPPQPPLRRPRPNRQPPAVRVRAVPVGPAGQVALRDRRCQRGPSRRRGAPRLRRQHQPRAQDPGRCPAPAGRGDPGSQRRPGGGAPLRRPDEPRVEPAGQNRAGAHRPVAAAGRRPASGRPAGRSVRGRGRGPGPHPPRRREQRDQCGGRRAPGRSGAGRRGAACHRGGQPRRQRDRLLPRAHPGRGRHPAARAGLVGDIGRRRGHRHLRARRGAHLRALLPGRPRPLPRHRRHRARAGDRQAHRVQPRRGRVGLERRGDRLHVHAAAARDRIPAVPAAPARQP